MNLRAVDGDRIVGGKLIPKEGTSQIELEDFNHVMDLIDEAEAEVWYFENELDVYGYCPLDAEKYEETLRMIKRLLERATTIASQNGFGDEYHSNSRVRHVTDLFHRLDAYIRQKERERRGGRMMGGRESIPVDKTEEFYQLRTKATNLYRAMVEDILDGFDPNRIGDINHGVQTLVGMKNQIEKIKEDVSNKEEIGGFIGDLKEHIDYIQRWVNENTELYDMYISAIESLEQEIVAAHIAVLVDGITPNNLAHVREDLVHIRQTFQNLQPFLNEPDFINLHEERQRVTDAGTQFQEMIDEYHRYLGNQQQQLPQQ